jgi:hypothetical protein
MNGPKGRRIVKALPYAADLIALVEDDVDLPTWFKTLANAMEHNRAECGCPEADFAECLRALAMYYDGEVRFDLLPDFIVE